MQAHWVDNEAAHKARLRRWTIEGYAAMKGLTAVALCAWAHAMWKLFHRACG
jgi:hypothetical protein